MRGVSRWTSRVARLLAAFLVLGAASAWAEESPAQPTAPPEARMSPPVGVSAQARMQPPVGIAPPPPPEATTQTRVQPPVGAPTTDHVSLFDRLRMWLRISIPHG